jgi:hypothetical protein
LKATSILSLELEALVKRASLNIERFWHGFGPKFGRFASNHPIFDKKMP